MTVEAKLPTASQEKQQGVFIHTFGCQMNDHDSQKIKTLLSQEGYDIKDKAEDADVILLNTCTVREKPELKVMSMVGRYRLLRENKPNLLIGVGGCFAKQEGENLIKRSAKSIDIVFGPDNIPELPQMILEAQGEKDYVVQTDFDEREEIRFLNIAHEFLPHSFSASVTIMKGCDKYCSFCIVPYVRGRERYRSIQDILNETLELCNNGVKEVMLLGQSVTSWKWEEAGQTYQLAELLRAVAKTPGLERLRFTSPYPRDFSDDLIECFGDVEQLCDHVHLPFQSGSDQILHRMNRRHTREEYFRWVDKLREKRKHLALTGDVIVGFPGETDEDFADTMDLIERVRFDNLYAFIYSIRPNTPAKKKDQVDEEVKKQRLQTLLERQKQITWEKNQELEGCEISVLVEGISKKNPEKFQGRTSGNKIAHFKASNRKIGEIVQVRITEGRPNSLLAELL